MLGPRGLEIRLALQNQHRDSGQVVGAGQGRGRTEQGGKRAEHGQAHRWAGPERGVEARSPLWTGS